MEKMWSVKKSLKISWCALSVKTIWKSSVSIFQAVMSRFLENIVAKL